MHKEFINNKTIITDVGPFDVEAIFTCGQAFRWHKTKDGWQGIAMDKMLTIGQLDDGIVLDCPKEDVPFWVHYLDLDYDYQAVRDRLILDIDLRPAIEAMPGLRFLNQPFYECLISFIISANNNIPRIKKIIEALSERYGKKVADGCYGFPTAKALANAKEEDVRACGAGYRASYIIEASNTVQEGFDHENLRTMPLDEARIALTALKGVGCKVADCVLLFSCHHRAAFPVDTWVRKAMAELYGESLKDKAIREIAKERFGEHGGLAQQYLFHSLRLKAMG